MSILADVKLSLIDPHPKQPRTGKLPALDEAIRMFTGAWPARRQVFAS